MHFRFNDAFDSDAVSALKINSMNKFSLQNAFRSSIPSILNGSIKTFRHFDFDGLIQFSLRFAYYYLVVVLL